MKNFQILRVRRLKENKLKDPYPFEMEDGNYFSIIGTMLVVLGILFLLLPQISRIIPDIEKIPWIFIWIYKRDGFTFVTSPILIFFSLISLIIYYLNR